ncbi:hypothetical protein [Candidatus Pyrohabitans sp.]
MQTGGRILRPVHLYRVGSLKSALINGIFGFTSIMFSVYFLLNNDISQFAVLFFLGLAFFVLAIKISDITK